MATSVRERTNKRNRGAFWPAKGGIVRDDSLARGLVLGDTYTDPVERYYFNRRLTRLKPEFRPCCDGGRRDNRPRQSGPPPRFRSPPVRWLLCGAWVGRRPDHDRRVQPLRSGALGQQPDR